MTSDHRLLQASIDDQVIGWLHEVNGLWSFQYNTAWLSAPHAHPLSPHLPLQPDLLMDGATQRPVQWYFDNLLPEEGQRELLARDARVDRADAFGLLTAYGAETAGSLTLLPPGATAAAAGLRPLPDGALSARIAQMPRLPLAHGAVKRMSLAGAQHKLAVTVGANDLLFEPEGSRASTHILKPDHPDTDYPHSVANEWFTMRLAARLSLDVPTVARRYVPEPVYLIQRFDRQANADGCKRLHAIDACQVLGLDRAYKYREGSIARLAELAIACRSPAVARTRLYAWLLFNVLIGNSDAHLKNLSFLVTHQGLQLAPFYDLLSVACYDTTAYNKDRWPATTELAWPILGISRFADVNRDVLLAAGTALGLNLATTNRLLDRLCQRIRAEADLLHAQLEAENADLARTTPALWPTLAGEARCIRTLRHVVIEDMLARFR